MATPTVTFDGLNINDGTTYAIQEGGSLGAPVLTFTEYRGYDGTVKQYNASTANLIEMHLPMIVYGSSVSNLRTNLAALNAKVGSCSSASPKILTFDGVDHYIVTSPQVAPTLSQSYQNKYFCFVDLLLYRQP